MDFISIKEAAAQGIRYLRKPVWANPCAHLKIDIFEGTPGPWVHLFDPCNKEANGRDPVNVLCIQMDYDKKEWLQHDGPTADSEEYKQAVTAIEALSR